MYNDKNSNYDNTSIHITNNKGTIIHNFGNSKLSIVSSNGKVEKVKRKKSESFVENRCGRRDVADWTQCFCQRLCENPISVKRAEFSSNEITFQNSKFISLTCGSNKKLQHK